MKLFLASSLDKTIELLKPLLTKEPELTKVMFIANAADPYDIEKWWVDADRNKFQALGYQMLEVDMRNVSTEEFSKALSEADVLHVCGGSVYYLMNLIQEKSLGGIIIEAVRGEKVLYTGTSAGSIIVSQSIAAFAYDEEETEHIQKVPDKRGLGLINFGIVPHCNNADFAEEHKKMIDHMVENVEPLIFLQDNQVVIFQRESFRILSI